MKKLNEQFVREVAEKLEPIYVFNSHHWGNDDECPRADEIASVIYELWNSAQHKGFSSVGTGGISLEEDGEEIVISYSRTMEFHWESETLMY